MPCEILTEGVLKSALRRQLSAEQREVLLRHLREPCERCVDLLEGWTAEEMIASLHDGDDLLSRAEQERIFGAATHATFTSPSILGENASFIFSTLSNLSDRSLITRLDFLTRVLSYLYLEAYADVHYGRHGGEFRLEINQTLPPSQPGGPPTVINVPAPLFDAGVGVRVKI